MHNNKPKISIGIPTYEAGDSLVYTLDSIYKQTVFNRQIDKVLLIVDGNKISKPILKMIKNKKLKIIYGKKRKGQSGRINDLLKYSKSDLTILTNDDVLLDKYAVENISKTYINTNADLITTNVKPLSPVNIIQKIIYTGYDLTENLTKNWNNYDNYLSCNGRMICLSRNLSKKIVIPEQLWNNDAFIYLFTKINNFKTARAVNATCYYLLPDVFKDHIKQSVKFKSSYRENQNYFNVKINKFYMAPFNIRVAAFFKHLLFTPITMIAFSFIYLVTEIYPKKKRTNKKGYWETDKSTKSKIRINISK